MKEKLSEIYKTHTNGDRRCLCGFREWCEFCDERSEYNKLLEEIRTVLYGPRPKPTLEQYGSHIVIPREVIYG